MYKINPVAVYLLLGYVGCLCPCFVIYHIELELDALQKSFELCAIFIVALSFKTRSFFI